MDFFFSPEQEELRKQVRDFLEEEIKQGGFEVGLDGWVDGFSPQFSRKLGQRGWIGYHWPKEYGGQGKSYLDRMVITEELMRYGAPVAFHWMGDRQIGPSLMAYGTEEQRRDFLPRIIRGEIYFCVGMSEPEAGSDLASLSTRAAEVGDGFTLSGQKVWTGGAHRVDYCYLVARTDPEAPKHKGISEFIVDMKTPGITVRPLVDLSGLHHLNEVYFDNVRLPKAALMGEKNRGWYQIVAQLDYERSGPERLMSNYPVFAQLKRFVQENPALAQKPGLGHKLVQLEVEYEVGRWLIYRVAWVLSRGRVPNYEASLAKIYGTAFQQRLASTAMEILGLSGQLLADSKWAPLKGMVARANLFCVGYTLMGGTSEILRNVVALRGLGLPSG